MAFSGRVQWIDGCKGLAILLVVLGHTMRTDLSLVYIYGFHMPLFFFLSGLVCNENKYTWASFLKSRFNTLVIPYLAFYLLTWLYWLFVERTFRPLGMEWWQPLIGIAYGAQWHGYMDHNAILWFLPCLFVTEILFFYVKKLPKLWIQLLSVLVLAAIGFLFDFNLPWCINIAGVALQYFFLGNLLRTLLLETEETKCKKNTTALVSMVAIATYVFLSAHWLNHVNMATNEYGIIVVFELLSFLGICGFVGACKWMNIGRWGGYFGRNTLVIFALHQPILRVIRYLGSMSLTDFPVETHFVYALFADLMVIVILVPFMMLWNKYGIEVLKRLYI